MSTNPVVPSAREALNKFKMEAASQVGVNLKQGYNGDLTAKEAGSAGGGKWVIKLSESYLTGLNYVFPDLKEKTAAQEPVPKWEQAPVFFA